MKKCPDQGKDGSVDGTPQHEVGRVSDRGDASLAGQSIGITGADEVANTSLPGRREQGLGMDRITSGVDVQSPCLVGPTGITRGGIE